MQKTLNQFIQFSSMINMNHIRFAFMLLALALLVLGAGAPEDVGGSAR